MKLATITEKTFSAHETLRHHLPLLAKAKQVFEAGDEVRFFKAPGRVNMIGEHTDYNMCPVLPCAVDKEIVFCVRQGEPGVIKLTNVEDEFEDISFSLLEDIKPYQQGHWGNYIKAGAKGIIGRCGGEKLRGFQAVISSTLPAAVGMSSSAALVVCSAQVLHDLNDLGLAKEELADICATAERFVGTAGGGMDQAACLLGRKDTFLKIDFNPLRVQRVKAPPGAEIVLCDSLARAEKSGWARGAYNRRVVECRLAMGLFKRYLAEHGESPSPMEYIGDIREDILGKGCAERVEGFLRWLRPEYDLAALAVALGGEEDAVSRDYLRINEREYLSPPADGFKPQQRFRHVYREWSRVEQAVLSLAAGDWRSFGKLMDESQESMAECYEISTPELDELCRQARQAGAFGARLTGAGFGGCVVALVARGASGEFIARLRDSFYAGEDVAGKVFVCRPSAGAGEIVLETSSS